MKIITQSTIQQKAPYFHLAYLAASSRTPERGLLSGGLLVILLGCILSFKLMHRKSANKKSWISSAIVLRKDNATWLVVGLIFIIAGITSIVLSFKYGKKTYSHPKHMTHAQIYKLKTLIEMHLELGESIPENMTSMSQQWQLSNTDVRDAWSNLMRLRTETINGATQYIITSAGKDGTFGTEDDVVDEGPFKRLSQKAPSQQTVNNADAQNL